MTERGHATQVLLAPDKFKGSLTAAAVAEALAAGMAEVVPQLETAMLPVADGGDGTVAAALSAGFDKITVDAIARPERRGCGVRPHRRAPDRRSWRGSSRACSAGPRSPQRQQDAMTLHAQGLALRVAPVLRRGLCSTHTSGPGSS